MCLVTLADVALSGYPPIHAAIKTGAVTQLQATLCKDDGGAGNDFSADTFVAAVQSTETDDNCDLPAAIPIDLTVTYSADADETYVQIEFPADGIPDAGRFGIKWTTVTGQDVWPLVGTYQRKNQIPY